jgi:glycosyltransferase involved in cell wall biosynthesis
MTSQHPNPSPPASVPVSVIILTRNEEKNILACLESCRWCDDVHVLDCGSTDRTQEIARQWGAQVHFNPFVSFGVQRNWAIDHIPCKNTWHFHLDADERFTPAIVAEMLRLMGPDGKGSRLAAYFVPSKLMFGDKWLRYSGGYPTYQVRFFHSGKCRFVDYGHTQREECAGEIGWMVNPYLHYEFSRGMAEWFTKHNDYSTAEAREAVAVRSRGMSFAGMASADALTRRRALKNLSFFFRARDVFRFIYMYFPRVGWLDAVPGFHYCMMMSSYEYWIELKIREQELGWPNRTTALAERLLAEARKESK